MTEWFEQWFGEEYLRLYPHRDDADAARIIDLIERHCPLEGCRVLDLGCGPGRHAAQAQRRGASVVGLDLSRPLLSRARCLTEGTVQLVRGDMRRLPFGRARFDLVINLFTSFGYFADDEQHADVVRQAADLLRPGGLLVLDYLNTTHVRATLKPREERAVGSQRVVIERRITADDRYVVKEMHLRDDGRSFLERVRLFTPDELEFLFANAGLSVTHRFGDYDGGTLSPAAPRAILMGRKS